MKEPAKNRALTMQISLPPRATHLPAAPLGEKPSAVSELQRKKDDESLYQKLLQILYDGALITDLGGQIIDANERVLDFLLYDSAELRGLSIVQIISGADAFLLQTILKNLADQRFTQIEGYCVRKDGTLFPTDIVVNRLQHLEKDQLCFFIRDITRRKLAEDNLRRSEAKNRALLHAIPDLMFRMDRDGTILDFKAATGGKMILPVSDFLGKKINQVFPKMAAQFISAAEKSLESKEPQIFEYQIPTGGGTSHFEGRIVVNEETEVLAIVRDITARKRAEHAEQEQAERDFQIAREIQRILLPSEFPKIQGVEVGAISVPAQKLGGDYYDVVQVDATHWGVAIADVSGKGVSGALLMAMCRSTLRMQAAGNISPAQVLRQLNRIICPDMQEDMFITMIYGIFDTQSRSFTFCRAGHEAPLLYHPSTQQVESPAAQGMALGIDEGPVFDQSLAERQVLLQKGDILMLYTDGISEAFNEQGQEFGCDQLVHAIRANAHCTAKGISENIENQVHGFIGKQPQNDDMTLLVFKVLS